MNKILSFTVLSLVCSPAIAQQYVTTPPTGTDQDGAGACFIFGWSSKMQMRFLDETHSMGTPMSLKASSFSTDYRDHNAIGRTWDKLTLDIAKADYNSASRKNAKVTLLSAPTRVFDRKWSFPTLSGKPALNPTSWGGPQGSLNFNFSQPWLYDGRDAIFTDYVFTGGVAANAATWGENFTNGFEYYLDTLDAKGWTSTTRAGATATVPAQPSNCYDSGYTNAAVATAGVTGYSNSRPFQVQMTIDSRYTSRTSPVIYAVGVAGLMSGLDIGAGCNRLYIDPSLPFLMFPQAAPNNGSARASMAAKAEWQPWMSEFWVQAAWEDSQSMQLKLTHATRIHDFSPASLPRMLTSYTVPSSKGPSVLSQWFTGPKALPITRYTY